MRVCISVLRGQTIRGSLRVYRLSGASISHNPAFLE
jgi:hypothetical protein